MDKILIIGGGGHAKLIIDIIETMQRYEILGIIDKQSPKNTSIAGYKVLGGDESLDVFINQGIRSAAMGIGGFKDNLLRKKIFLEFKARGIQFINPIHPKTVISRKASIGEGTTIFAGGIINNDVKIGDNCIIATGSSIDHETIVESHVLISAGVTIGGYCRIKEGALLARGSKVVSGITIGENSLVAAGAVVVSNIDKNQRAFGIPARSKE